MPKLGLGLDVTAGTGTLANPDFVSTWTVSGDETARTVTLPLTNVSGITTINFTIDWGDGSSLSTVTAHDDSDRVHIYAENGTYTVIMSGVIGGLYFNDGGDKTKLRTITNWGTFQITNTDTFYGCSELTAITASDAPTISNTSLRQTFKSCTALATFGIGFRYWDVSSVTDIYQMCQGARYFDADMSDWDTSEVTNMQYVFGFVDLTAMSNTGVGNWNVSKVTTMSQMFNSASLFNGDLSDWDTGAVLNMSSMFNNADAFVGNGVDSFDIADVTNMTSMFASQSALTTANYDALLIAWEAQTEQADVVFHAGSATYTGGGTAATARAALVTNGWTITDGGIA